MHLYETHLPVSDVEQSVSFYCDIVGLQFAFEVSQRNVTFLWVGADKQGMLGLWGPGSAWGWPPGKADGQSHRCHFAIHIPLEDLLAAPARLQQHGITVVGFDGHSVEYITMLDELTDADYVGTWSDWQARR